MVGAMTQGITTGELVTFAVLFVFLFIVLLSVIAILLAGLTHHLRTARQLTASLGELHDRFVREWPNETFSAEEENPPESQSRM